MTIEFDAFVAPLGVTAFFSNHYEKKHLHLSAGGDARSGLLSWDEFFSGLLANPTNHAGVLCFPEQIEVTREQLFSDEAVLRRYLEAGHPIVWNRARALSPRIAQVCNILANTFGAHVWPNVYATGEAGTPFEMHFDAHEVIAVHCAGRKTWDISRVRVNRPIEAIEMATAVTEEIRQRSFEAGSNIEDTFTVSPGDLVYIPRGQFHNARTESGRSLHVTFGIEMPTGYDLAKRIFQGLLADPQMREYPLPKAMDPDGIQLQKWIADIIVHVGRATSVEELALEHDKLRQLWIRKSSFRLEK
jgi:hypothetical protein